MDPISTEEFGKKMTRASKRFLDDKKKHLSLLATHLEDHYSSIILHEHLPLFQKLSPDKICKLRAILGAPMKHD